MAYDDHVHKGHVGFRLVILIRDSDNPDDDVATATTIQIKARVSGGTWKTFTATVGQAPDYAGDGSDGVIEFTTTLASDLDAAGVWEAMPYLVGPGFDYHTGKVFFDVLPIPA